MGAWRAVVKLARHVHVPVSAGAGFEPESDDIVTGLCAHACVLGGAARVTSCGAHIGPVHNDIVISRAGR